MYTVSLYIGGSSKLFKASKKKWAYLLEYQSKKGKHQVADSGEDVATYHENTLRTILRALRRLQQSCKVLVHTEDRYVLSMIEEDLQRWAKNDFKNSKGEDLAIEWRQIWELMKGQKIEGVAGAHDYEILLGGMMGCLKNSES